jgi:hypothetical protein
MAGHTPWSKIRRKSLGGRSVEELSPEERTEYESRLNARAESERDDQADDDGMKLTDFKIGQSFWTTTGEWRCTDIGTRVVVAIHIGKMERQDPTWLNGPPYAIAEEVFDEYDFGGCFATEQEAQESLGGPTAEPK